MDFLWEIWEPLHVLDIEQLLVGPLLPLCKAMLAHIG